LGLPVGQAFLKYFRYGIGRVSSKVLLGRYRQNVLFNVGMVATLCSRKTITFCIYFSSLPEARTVHFPTILMEAMERTTYGRSTTLSLKSSG
jgi:hypothetical protein